MGDDGFEILDTDGNVKLLFDEKVFKVSRVDSDRSVDRLFQDL
jgi:hypothetical protein